MSPTTLAHVVSQTNQMSAVTCGAVGRGPGELAREFWSGAMVAEPVARG